MLARIALILISVSIILTSLPVSASERFDVKSMTDDANELLESGDWKNSEELLEKVIEFHTSRDLVTPRPIGSLLFKKGWCELKQQKWAEAQKSFKWCYKKYPDIKKNPYHRLALRGWADAAMGSGDLETAAKIYRKYIEEASRTDWRNPFAKKPK